MVVVGPEPVRSEVARVAKEYDEADHVWIRSDRDLKVVLFQNSAEDQAARLA